MGAGIGIFEYLAALAYHVNDRFGPSGVDTAVSPTSSVASGVREIRRPQTRECRHMRVSTKGESALLRRRLINLF